MSRPTRKTLTRKKGDSAFHQAKVLSCRPGASAALSTRSCTSSRCAVRPDHRHGDAPAVARVGYWPSQPFTSWWRGKFDRQRSLRRPAWASNMSILSTITLLTRISVLLLALRRRDGDHSTVSANTTGNGLGRQGCSLRRLANVRHPHSSACSTAPPPISDSRSTRASTGDGDGCLR
jgi:hypothetical protein